MEYHIVAGEELKKRMQTVLKDPIPFNEDMSRGTFSSEPFSPAFVLERSAVHGVEPKEYEEKLSKFLRFYEEASLGDVVHLYFGEDAVCMANRSFLASCLKPKVGVLFLHMVDEYTGRTIRDSRLK